MIALYCLTLPGSIDPRTLGRLLDAVSADRREALARVRDPRDALRGACGELLARHVLSAESGVPEARIRFSRGASGKPSPPAEVRRRFNVSHSGDLVVCATAGVEVGVDVEKIGPINIENVRTVLDAVELDRFMKLHPSERQGFFFDRWTMKESFLKAVGTGLSIEPGSFRVEDDAEGPYVVTEGEPYRLSRYAVAKGYALAVCARGEEFAAAVTAVAFSDIAESSEGCRLTTRR